MTRSNIKSDQFLNQPVGVQLLISSRSQINKKLVLYLVQFPSNILKLDLIVHFYTFSDMNKNRFNI